MSQFTIDPTDPTAERAAVAEAWSRWLPGVLADLVTDGGGNDGGFIQAGWCDGREAAYRLSQLIAARYWAGEIGADRVVLEDAIRRITRFILRRQNPDGRMDLGGMYSPNEVGFTLPGLVAGYRRLESLPGRPLGDVTDLLAKYIRLGAEAVLVGSAYTANHRWAAAAGPLAAVHSLWPDSRYVAKIDDYLADGLDCDEDGSWHVERSPNYNTVANHGVIIIADCLGRQELLKTVVRSMEFLLNNLQPNGEADSTYSHRQDRLMAGRLPCDYSVARRVAQITGDGRFTTLAKQVWNQTRGLPSEFIPIPYDIDDRPGPLPAPKPLPERYEKLFAGIGVARMRAGDSSVTLSCDRGGHFFDSTRDQWGGPKNSDDWIHIHAGDIVLETVRIAGAGMTYIQPRQIVRSGDGAYQLSGFVKGWKHPLHFRPGSPVIDMTWDWRSEIDVRVDADDVDVHIVSEAPNSLRSQAWFWVRPGVTLVEGSGQPVQLTAGAQVTLRGGVPVVLTSKTHRLEIVGLPKSAHQVTMLPTESIPSRVVQDGAGLSLGLLFPMDMKFTVRHTRRDV